MEKPLKVKKDGTKKFTERTQTPRDYPPSENDLKLLEFIHRHRYVASNILFEFAKGVYETQRYDEFQKTYLIKKLYDGQWVMRPMAQRYTEQPDGNYHVYSLTEKAEKLLYKLDRLEPVVKHSGMFPHQLMGATFTATIDIMCRREGYRFIPAHEYLNGGAKKVLVPFEWDGKVIDDKRHALFDPDYLYAIDFGNSKVAFLPEFNRSTEPEVSESYFRRTDKKTLLQLEQLIVRGDYKSLYGRKWPMFYQFITVSEEHAQKFLEAATVYMSSTSEIMAQVMPSFESPFRPPPFPAHLFTDPWMTTGRDFTIKKTA